MTTLTANPFTGKGVLNTILVFTFFSLLAGCNMSSKQASTVPNSGLHPHHLGVKSTLYYHTSIENQWMYQQLYELASEKLIRNFNANVWDIQPAVILDIDETVLDNSRYEIENIALGRTYTSETWKQWTAKAEAPALPGALNFCKLADSLGIKIIYLSNREVDETQGTQKNLTDLGFPQSENLLLKSGPSDKTERRTQVQKNHAVLLYLGDNLRDFSEDFSQRSEDFGKDVLTRLSDSLRTYFVLFPNPMYGEWEKPVAPVLKNPSSVTQFLDN